MLLLFEIGSLIKAVFSITFYMQTQCSSCWRKDYFNWIVKDEEDLDRQKKFANKIISDEKSTIGSFNKELPIIRYKR